MPESATLVTEQFAALDQVRATLIDQAIRFGPKVLVALLILMAGFFMGRWLGRLADRGLYHLAIDAPVRQLLVQWDGLLPPATASTCQTGEVTTSQEGRSPK
jgi:hypothetical protein